MIALAARSEPVATYFLEQGVDSEKSDTRGNTPLMLAAQGRYLALVDRLLGSGANICARNMDGRDAEHFPRGETDAWVPESSICHQKRNHKVPA